MFSLGAVAWLEFVLDPGTAERHEGGREATDLTMASVD